MPPWHFRAPVHSSKPGGGDSRWVKDRFWKCGNGRNITASLIAVGVAAIVPRLCAPRTPDRFHATHLAGAPRPAYTLVRRYRKMPIAFFKIGLAIELMRSTLFRMKMSYMSLRVAIVAAGFVQLIGIGVFFFAMWSRIRPVGSQARESRGERF